MHVVISPSEGFSGGSQSSVAVNSQLPFPAASQTHLTSGIQGWCIRIEIIQKFKLTSELSQSIYILILYMLFVSFTGSSLVTY